MKRSTKRLTSAALAAVLAASVTAVGVSNAGAIKNDDDTYTPSAGVAAKTYKFAMPGCWESDYWKTNEDCMGIYWWTGADTPGTVFDFDWPGYRVNRTTDEVGVENLYSTPVSADANMIIFNNHIDGGMPGTEGFLQERFDAACQIKETQAQYYCMGESDYYSKELWAYVWDKAAEAVDYDDIDWDMSENEMTEYEVEQVSEIYETLLDENIELEIPEFGDYSKNFFVEAENGDGIGLSFDNMVYVVNLDPNTMTVSTTIIPEGKVTYGGEWMFYYGNGKYGTWPTEELLEEYGGIAFDDNDNPYVTASYYADRYVTDEYGTINTVYYNDYTGGEQKLMAAGNFTKAYAAGEIDVPDPSDPYDPSYPTYDAPDDEPEEYLGDNSIYFYVNNRLWRNYKYITMYMYAHDGSDFPLSLWGSKRCRMVDCGNGFWGFDFDDHDIEIINGKQYGIIFTADWGVQTCDIIFDKSLMGGVAYCNGEMVENNVDSAKKSYDVRWNNAAADLYGPPVCITALGNIIGTAFWADTTPYSMLVDFIRSDGWDGLDNALRYNGKTAQQTIDDIAIAFGLTKKDIENAIRESGKDVDWSKSRSTAPSGEPDVPQITALISGEEGITIHWDEFEGAYGYRLYYQNDSGNWKSFKNIVRGTSMTDAGVKYGKEETYTIRAVDRNGSLISGYNPEGWSAVYRVDTPEIYETKCTADGIEVSWMPVSDVKTYRVYYKTADGSWARFKNDVTGTTKLDTGVKYGRTETYTVRAVNKKGEVISGYNPVGRSVDYKVDTPWITNLENLSNGIKITWEAVPGVSAYRVYYKKADGSWARFKKDVTGTSMIDTGVMAGREETYTIRCVNAKGDVISDYFAEGWSQVFDYACVTPQITKLESTAAGIKLSWNAVNGAYGYRVYYKNSSGSWKSFSKDTTDTTFTDAAVAYGREETYTIRCVDKEGNVISGYDPNGWSQVYGVDYPALRLENTADGIKISWDAVEGVSTYRVYYKKADGSWTRFKNDVTGTSMLDKGVKVGREETYTIRCVNAKGDVMSGYKPEGWSIVYQR